MVRRQGGSETVISPVVTVEKVLRAELFISPSSACCCVDDMTQKDSIKIHHAFKRALGLAWEPSG